MINAMEPINVAYSPYYELLKQSHQFQGATNHCGPFCAAITINTLLGTHLSGFDLSTYISPFRRFGVFPILQRVPNWATLPWAVSFLMKDYGLSSGIRYRSTISNLISCLASERIPLVVVGEWSPVLWSHYLVVACYDYAQGVGVVDPAQQSADISWIPLSVFDRRWNHFGRILIWAKLPDEILLKD